MALAGFVGLACFVLWRLISGKKFFETLIFAWLLGGSVTLMLVGASGLPFSDRYVPSGAAIIAVALLVDQFRRKHSEAMAKAGRVPAILFTGYLGVLAAFAFISTVRCQSAVGFFLAMADDDVKLSYPRVVLTNIMLSRYQDIALSDPYFREAVAIAPDEPRVRSLGITRAIRFIEAKEYELGLKALEWSAEVLSDDANLWSLRAKCYAGMSNFPDALISIQRAIQLAPNVSSYRVQLDEDFKVSCLVNSGMAT